MNKSSTHSIIMIYLIKKYIIFFLVIIFVGLLIPLFVYINEPKETIYTGKISLPKIDEQFKPIFVDFLNSNSFKFNEKQNTPCITDYTENNMGFLDITVRIVLDENIEDQEKVINDVVKVCGEILYETLERFMNFNSQIIQHYEKNSDELNYQYTWIKIQELNNKNFFLKFVSERMLRNGVKVVKIYEPSGAIKHLTNIVFTFIILTTLVLGFFVARQNLAPTKKKYKKK